MKRLLATAALIIASGPALACETATVGSLEISQAWSRASNGTSRPGVVYLTIRNAGAAADALTGIATPVSGMPMLHQTVMTQGVASMQHAMQVPVPAGGSVALAPGGYHAMLMDLTESLKEGETFPVTLSFRDAGEVTIPVMVQSTGASGPGCADDGQ
ncbi:MAG: copper chaperone PCu(A)C [Paracoccus sp. (in: a-proteobacteria)]|uniref:copper chaperone PCu(A)C n=1 Tax=Paracoccus sp. TaxID=267 RepID=UPI00391AB988